MINFILAHLNKAGGIETATVSTANELVKKGKKVRIITTAQADNTILPIYDLDKSIEVVHLRMSRALCLPDMYLDEQFKKKRFWAPLIVIFTFLTLFIRIPMYRSRLKKFVKPGDDVIVSCNEGLYIINKKTRNYFWMHFAADRAWWERKFALMNKSKLYGLIMMTETDAKYMQKSRFWKKANVFHALNMTRFKQPIDTTDRDSKLVFIGRISLQKNPLMLVDFAKMLKEKHKEFTLEIYGDGTNNMKKRLIKKMEKNNVGEYVKFVGRTNNSAQTLSSADGLVLISRLEGLPMVVQEAKICSCVPMVLKWGANTNEAILDGKSGIVATSLEQLTDKIASLLRDKQRLTKLKENAYEHAKLTYPENVIEIWINEILK